MTTRCACTGGVVVASQCGGTHTFDAPASGASPPPPNEGVVGIMDANFGKTLALSSVQSEMPNNVQTTDKPVVVMVAPRQILRDRSHNTSPSSPNVETCKQMENTRIE